jgi:hypothetical protein
LSESNRCLLYVCCMSIELPSELLKPIGIDRRFATTSTVGAMANAVPASLKPAAQQCPWSLIARLCFSTKRDIQFINNTSRVHRQKNYICNILLLYIQSMHYSPCCSCSNQSHVALQLEPDQIGSVCVRVYTWIRSVKHSASVACAVVFATCLGILEVLRWYPLSSQHCRCLRWQCHACVTGEPLRLTQFSWHIVLEMWVFLVAGFTSA